MNHRLLPIVALLAPVAAQAAAPPVVPVTGYLVDSTGAPVNDTVTLHLGLYTSGATPTALWSEDQVVDVDGGQFTVYLGDEDPLTLLTFRDNGTLFLGIAVDTGPEMTPRFEIATAPFAAFAQYSADAATVGGIDPLDLVQIGDPIDWTDLQNVPSGLQDGDQDTTYSAGLGIDLSTARQFSVNQGTVEGWARALAYDTAAELRTELDAVYQARQSCTVGQLLVTDALGAFVCTDANSLPVSESAVDAAVANNGYAAATALAALDGRVATAEGRITTLQTNVGTLQTNVTSLQGSVFDLTANHTLSGNNNFTGVLRVPTGATLPAVAAAGGLFLNTTDRQLYTSNGTAWVRLTQAAGTGSYPTSCRALKTAAPATPDGIQWIDPDGAGVVAPYQAYCDMTTSGGGWTLVWAKTSPSFNTWSGTADYSCARNLTGDCASAVPAALTWTRAMWRFADSASVVVEYDGSASEFNSYLNGANVSNLPTVGGWTKTVGGAVTGPASIPQLHYYAANGISEQHANSDQWIDLWTSADGSNNYTFSETSASWGTKCLGGWCRYDATALFFVR